MIREYPKEAIEQKKIETLPNENERKKIVEILSKEDEKMLLYFMVFTLALVGIIGITVAIALKK
jgi:hypothetical protein